MQEASIYCYSRSVAIINRKEIIIVLVHRATAKDSGRLLDDGVAGEVSDYCDAGQSG